MSDFFGKITNSQDAIKQLASKIPGFDGYVERQNRRAADKLLRETVADRFDALWQRLSRLQNDMLNTGMIGLMDEAEKAALALRTFSDKIRRASYGYSGFFDAVKINEEELARLYAFDMAFLDIAEQIDRALDNMEASLSDEASLQAAIRSITTQAREALSTFERRYEIINGAQG